MRRWCGNVVWAGCAVALLAVQGQVAAWWFGGWKGLRDERPVVSGRHGVHQYHGVLGASQLRRTGQNVCYDPSFEAGYPKTPVFDEGCRLAEVLLWVSGCASEVSVYKWGLWILVAAVPAAAMVAAWGWNWSKGGVLAAGAVWGVLSASSPARELLAAGVVDGWAAALAAVVFVAWLTRFSETLAVEAWLISAAAALTVWYCQPWLWLPLAVVVFVHYLVWAPQRGLAWHLAYVGIACVGVLPNAWWLADWAKYWWLRPGGEWGGGGTGTWWWWGGLAGGGLLWWCGVAAALAGWGQRWRHGVLLALTSTILGASAWVGAAWLDEAGRRSLELLSVAAAVLGGLGAAETLWRGSRWQRGLGVVMAVGWLATVAATGRPAADAVVRLGLDPTEQELVAVLREQTTTQARILWEERAGEAVSWPALLPLWTERYYIGGLHAPLEHAYCVLRDGRWLGRPLERWSDGELEERLQRFNIGWVVARTEQSEGRWQRYPGVRLLWRGGSGVERVAVFALPRSGSYVLSGRVARLTASVERIVLEEAEPDADGSVVLSLHWQAGMRVSPGYVRVERAPDPRGQAAVDFIRLQMPGPVPRLSITWDNP